MLLPFPLLLVFYFPILTLPWHRHFQVNSIIPLHFLIYNIEATRPYFYVVLANLPCIFCIWCFECISSFLFDTLNIWITGGLMALSSIFVVGNSLLLQLHGSQISRKVGSTIEIISSHSNTDMLNLK